MSGKVEYSFPKMHMDGRLGINSDGTAEVHEMFQGQGDLKNFKLGSHVKFDDKSPFWLKMHYTDDNHFFKFRVSPNAGEALW